MRLSTNEHVDCLYQPIIKEAEFNTFLCFLRHGLTLNVLYTYDFFLKKIVLLPLSFSALLWVPSAQILWTKSWYGGFLGSISFVCSCLEALTGDEEQEVGMLEQ